MPTTKLPPALYRLGQSSEHTNNINDTHTNHRSMYSVKIFEKSNMNDMVWSLDPTALGEGGASKCPV